MKLFKNLKKGFTLIELVVVIAVIAILSAVSVVSYVSITNKAKNSDDETVLRQVNMAIAMRKTETEPATMSDALLALKEEGGVSDVEKLLTATYKKNTFAYDQVNKEFVLLKEGEEPKGEKINYFKMVANQEELKKANDEGYSCYLKEIFSGKAITTKALDVGENADITSVEYSNPGSAQNVVIRTNGGDLTVDAEKDAVNHYGSAVLVKIDAVAPHSYYENGFVSGGLYVTKGHVVVKSNSENEKTATLIVIKGTDVDIEVKDNTPVMLATGVTPTANTKLNGAKVSENSSVKTIESLTQDNFISKVQTGGIYSLGEDISLNSQVDIPSGISCTFDLNGKKISYSGNVTVNSGLLLVHNGGELIVNDTLGTGKIVYSEKVYGGIALTKNGDNASLPAKLTINGGTIEGFYYSVVGNGSRHNTITMINGGVVRGIAEESTGIYHPQNGKLNITGGLIEGDTGLYIKSGALTLDSKFIGGTVRGTGTRYEYEPQGSGFNSTGDAIAVDNCNYPGGTPSISLGNIKLESINGFDIGAYYMASTNGIAEITSTSNKFSLNDGYKWEQTVAGIFKVVEAK